MLFVTVLLFNNGVAVKLLFNEISIWTYIYTLLLQKFKTALALY